MRDGGATGGRLGARTRTEVQQVTVECPVNRHLAKVEVRCRVQSYEPGSSQEWRILPAILSCIPGPPEIGCHPACEEDIRHHG